MLNLIYVIEFLIGDPSGDGHNNCEHFKVKSNKPVQEVRKAHFRDKEVLGFEIGDICNEACDSALEKEVVEKLKELNYDFKLIEDNGGYYEGEYDLSWHPEAILDIWLFLLMQIDPELTLTVIEEMVVTIMGRNEESKYLEAPGYGIYT